VGWKIINFMLIKNFAFVFIHKSEHLHSYTGLCVSPCLIRRFT